MEITRITEKMRCHITNESSHVEMTREKKIDLLYSLIAATKLITIMTFIFFSFLVLGRVRF